MTEEVPEYSKCLQISREDKEKLVDRLYTQSIESKKQKLEELEARYYPKKESKKISKEDIQKSVLRQVDEEMEFRRRAQAQAEANVYTKDAKTKKSADTAMSPLEIEESVKRMYDEALQRKEKNLEQSRKQYMFDPEKSAPTKKAPPGELKEYFEKISKPKKTDFSTDEINAIYGLRQCGCRAT
ncbi:hypothetical protein STCU_05337 [Strigomonas culicis]|uniref:Uncharacterized protein n=1 Tax=Strigomonas culicis TaxID=28005 RepID=S9UGI4_9TRYP|nr:hypothetical protein STCU_05337 [Strigomonas culicis]|eukprot:EPY28028.1 hypothetical protein STCU_05337 [Strigomonas culicis]